MKTIIKSLSAVLAVLSMAFGVTSTAQAEGYGKQKVAYHINAVGAENLDLRFIMHGKGLSMLLLPEEAAHTKLPQGNASDKQQASIENLKKQGVTFKVCANTLKGKKIDIDQLYDAEAASDVVPSGVAEIAKLQAKGFAYLRP